MKKKISIKLYLILIIFTKKTIPSEKNVFLNCLNTISTKCMEKIASVINNNISIQKKEIIFQENIQNCIKKYPERSAKEESKELLKKTLGSKEIESMIIKEYQKAMKENDFRDSF